MRWSSGIYNDYAIKSMPSTVDPKLIAETASNPSSYYGTKGTAVSGWWMNSARLYPETFMKEVGKPKAVLPRIRADTPRIFSMLFVTADVPVRTLITPHASQRSC